MEALEIEQELCLYRYLRGTTQKHITKRGRQYSVTSLPTVGELGASVAKT